MSDFIQLGEMFWKSKTKVYCEWKEINIDPKHAKVFFDTWATDGKKVYSGSFHRRMIDAKTFVALNSMYAKDANACYCENISVFKAIANADPTTFEVLDPGKGQVMFGLGKNLPGGYARDKANVYFNGNVIKNADSSSFVSLMLCYGKDRESIYYNQFRLKGAEPLRWRYLGGNYSRDDKHVFYENNKVDNARVIHFQQIEPFDSEFAYDGETFYYRGEACETSYYTDCVKRGAGYASRFADLVSSGRWQKNMKNSEWPYREPDMTLLLMRAIDLDYSIEDIEKKLGPRTVVAETELAAYLDFPLDDDSDKHEVVKWMKDDHLLVCVFTSGKMKRRHIDKENMPEE